jgi:hypothetical protein
LKPYQPQQRVSPEGANLIGFPAIRQLLIEIDNGNATPAMLGEPIDMSSARAFEESLQGITAGPRVRLLPPAFRPTNDVIRLPVRYVDASRSRLGPQATTPQLATAPLLPGVRAGHGGRQVTGNFLFDTGSSITMISRRLAFGLGLITSADPRQDRPDFENQFVGANNREIKAPGFIVDTLELLAPDGRIVQWRKVPVLVHDVPVRQEDGGFEVHDGIIGNNLFLASTNGELGDYGLKVQAAPFSKYWFHGPLGELWLLPPAKSPAG